MLDELDNLSSSDTSSISQQRLWDTSYYVFWLVNNQFQVLGFGLFFYFVSQNPLHLLILIGFAIH